jgi:hypothetical protein
MYLSGEGNSKGFCGYCQQVNCVYALDNVLLLKEKTPLGVAGSKGSSSLP